MSMLMKWSSGTRKQAAAKSTHYVGGEYSDEYPHTEPSDTRTTALPDGTYDKPYTNWKSKNYTTTATRNLGAATKLDGTSVVDDTIIRWYNLLAMWRLRKIAKRYSKYGVSPTAPTTKLWSA